MNEYYIVYDSQLDKFVKIKKLKEEELVKCIESYATFLTGKDVGISDYIKKLPNLYGNNVDVMVEAKAKELSILPFIGSTKMRIND